MNIIKSYRDNILSFQNIKINALSHSQLRISIRINLNSYKQYHCEQGLNICVLRHILCVLFEMCQTHDKLENMCVRCVKIWSEL